VDADFGHSLASKQPSWWTIKMARAAYKMLRKYRRQLEGFGIDFDSIDDPNDATETVGRPRAKRSIDAQGGFFILSSPYDAELVDRIKQLPYPSRKWQGDSKTWRIAAKEAALINELADTFAVTDAAKALLGAASVDENAKREAQSALVDLQKAEDTDLEIDGLGGELRPFQRVGVKYALGAKRVLIGDEMGLGKTIEALAVMQGANAFPAVVVCPASLKFNWENEAKKWLPGKSVVVLSGKGRDNSVRLPRYQDITVINYDIIGEVAPVKPGSKRRVPVLDKGWLPYLMAIDPKLIVFDEAHMLKNPKTTRTILCSLLAKKAEYCLPMSGSPVLNKPIELVPILRMLRRLDDFGGWKGFTQRYCNAYQGTFGWSLSGAEHLDELNAKMRKSCYIRRRKIEVLRELPAKQHANIGVELSRSWRKEYDRADEDIIRWIGEQTELDLDFLDAISDLPEEDKKQLVADRRKSAEWKARQAEALIRITKLKQLAARAKLGQAKEWIENFLESGEKLVVFAHHKEFVKELCTHFKCDSIDGSVSATNRQAAVDRFQGDRNTKLIICNMQAGGVGITLTAASNVFFLELGWTPALHAQAEDRCHRIGQSNNVTCWYMLARETIDDEIFALISSKRNIVDAVTEGFKAGRNPSVFSEIMKSMKKRAKESQGLFA
jgi:SNF2 family DNA or RNA helicase